MTPLVIYHGGCYDGFAAAWIAHCALDEPELYPTGYGQDPPDVKDRNVYVLDFSYSRAVLGQMHADAHSLLVLDHHKTAEVELNGLPYCRFDMERSGAGMTWDHFHPDKPRPWLVDYVEDRDLWRFALPDSKLVNGYISSMPLELHSFDGLEKTTVQGAVRAGIGIRNFHDRINESVLSNAYRTMLAGQRVWCVNAPYKLASELAGELAERGEPGWAFTWFVLRDGRIQASLRARSGADVSEIAKTFGGGGHAGAAGCILPSIPEQAKA